MTGTSKDFIYVLRGEVGYREGPNNQNKYGKWDGTNMVPWCGQFISWCLDRAGVPGDWKGVDSQRSTVASLEYWKSRNRLVTEPKPGDLVFFNWPGGDSVDHMGAVIGTSDWNQGVLMTIEGNSNDGVRIRTRHRESVVAFARPNFVAQLTDREIVARSAVILRRGMDGHEYVIKALQRILRIGPDGIFGPLTESAVRNYQGTHGLVTDGIVGPKTKATLNP